MTTPLWMSHPLSRSRAEDMGLLDEPCCGACAEYIYCGTVFAAHNDACTVTTAEERAARANIFVEVA